IPRSCALLPFDDGNRTAARNRLLRHLEDEEAVGVGRARALRVGVLRQFEGALEGARRALDSQEKTVRAVRRAADALEREDAALDVHRDLVGLGAGNLEHEPPALRVLDDVDRRQNLFAEQEGDGPFVLLHFVLPAPGTRPRSALSSSTKSPRSSNRRYTDAKRT